MHVTFSGDDEWPALVTDPERLPGPLLLRFRRDARGRARVAGMRLDSPDRPLTAAVLRRLPLGAYEDAAVRVLLDLLDDEEAGALVEEGRLGSFVAEVVELERPLSRPTEGLTDDFLRRVADAYYARVRRGEAAPHMVLSAEAGVPPRTIRGWVHEARRRGIMPPGRQGAVG